jgi:sugar phosphate isomerase/epimerase
MKPERRPMTIISRRTILQMAATSVVASRAAWAAPRTLGVQLYTVRNQIQADPEGTLKAIAAIGYKELEFFGPTLASAGALAKQLGLLPVSAHINPSIVTGGGAEAAALADRLAAPIAEARKFGIGYIVLPYLMPNERAGGADFYKALAAKMNIAGEQVAKAGMKFCYHNHGFEFEPLADGSIPLDLLMRESDPKLVSLELDVFWVGITGADPVALLKKYSGRVALVHLKDKAKTAPRETQESKVPASAFVEVGSGALDFPAILAAARAAGAQHYFVEQDQSPAPLESLKKSFAYLQGLPG